MTTTTNDRQLLDPHKDVRHLLEYAINVLEARGHTKGQLVDDHGRVCALGALNIATLETCALYDTHILACSMLANHVGASIVSWNDASTTTENDVLQMMRKVAAS